MKAELEGSVNRPKEVCGWRHGRKGNVSRADLSTHSKTSFYGYTRASLHLRTAIFAHHHRTRGAATKSVS